MKTKVIITNTLCLLLLLPLAESRQEGAKGGEAEAAPPIAIRPNDVDLGHGYVRRDGAIHFIGGGVTGTGANATRIDTPSARVLRGFRNAKYGPFETAEGLDVASFEPLSEEYARDESHVYYKVISPGVFLVVQVPEADPASFEPLAFPLARDKNHVWYHNEIQPGVDPEKREILGTMTAEVTPGGLGDVRISPLPGSSDTPTVPDWQLAAFNRPDLVDRMKQAGKLLGFLAIAGGIDPSTAAEEQAARSAVAIVERDRMLAQWLDRASSGFDRTRADLVRDHGLSEEQEAELEQVFARRKSELADLFTEMVSEEEKDDKAIFTGIGSLIRNKGLREDLAGILSDQQLEAFDARSDQRRRDTFEARAYRDMAEVHAVVQLTEAQQQDVIALFAGQAAERVEEEADARAFMSLVYGPVAAAMGSAMVRGMADMMNLDPAEQPNLEFGSDEHQQWTVEQQEKRIEIEISRLRDVLDDDQLTRYREHLEAEPPR